MLGEEKNPKSRDTLKSLKHAKEDLWYLMFHVFLNTRCHREDRQMAFRGLSLSKSRS